MLTGLMNFISVKREIHYYIIWDKKEQMLAAVEMYGD
jgi:hypothetical protein